MHTCGITAVIIVCGLFPEDDQRDRQLQAARAAVHILKEMGDPEPLQLPFMLTVSRHRFHFH